MIKVHTKLFFFLKAPYIPETYSPIKPKVFFGLMGLTLLIIIPYALILESAGIDQFDNMIEQMLKDNKWLVAILAIFLAPILEEPIFRLHLDLKRSSIWWSVGLAVILLAQIWWLILVFWVYLFYLMYNISKGNTPNLRFVIWTSSAFFGMIHMGNYTDFDYSSHFYWVPFMVGAQFVVGLVLSYIRLNHGMKWAMIFHGVYNAVLIIPAVYFYEG